ncbi:MULTISPECIES: hypothetical protein [unclassified Acidovorax]|uniref:hypothetical protein n=1 Tax=unclassified Acidovorax TaxID=2684926 RepID=UPI002882DF34|nr:MULTISPECIES: hypothetical protein [unclassified Acidovorax]
MFRAFGLVGLVVALAIVAVLAKRQMAAPQLAVPALPTVTGSPQSPASAPTGSVRDQSQQIQQQVRQQMDTLMQQPRPMPEDESK